MLRQEITVRQANFQPDFGDYVLLRCNCGHARCCKLISFNAVYERVRLQKDDPTGCPADSRKTCDTFSGLVERFRPIIEKLLPSHWYIWDMHDVPGHARMHIDMVAVDPQPLGALYRFEIDGRLHFSGRGESRKWHDVKKDMVLNQHAATMLRVHHGDERVWSTEIEAYVHVRPMHVVYTPSYGL